MEATAGAEWWLSELDTTTVTDGSSATATATAAPVALVAPAAAGAAGGSYEAARSVGPASYRLHAVVSHYGNRAEAGHYTTTIRLRPPPGAAAGDVHM